MTTQRRCHLRKTPATVDGGGTIAQRLNRFDRSRVTVVRIGREKLLDDDTEVRRNMRRHLRQRLSLTQARGHHDREIRGAIERARTAQRLVEDDAHRPEIRASIHRLTERLLRRHIGRFALHGARCCGEPGLALDPIAMRWFRDTEIREFEVALQVQKDVRRADVTMHKARRLAVNRVLMRARQRLKDIEREHEREVDRKWLA